MKQQDKPRRTARQLTLRMKPDVHYVWVGGSCDYAHEERAGGGAYLMQLNGETIDRYAIADLHTTEFRMMLTVMLHAMAVIPEQSEIIFLTNVSYLQNFDKTPGEKAANPDLITQCIAAIPRHRAVTVKIVSYHKYRQLPDTHEMAHQAMTRRRQEQP